MKTISEFELIDHKIQHSQYFQGCGTVFTRFEHVITGIGNNPMIAICDCLNQMAMAGFNAENMEARIMKQEGWEALPTDPAVQWNRDIGEVPNDQLYYYVSILWNEDKENDS